MKRIVVFGKILAYIETNVKITQCTQSILQCLSSSLNAAAHLESLNKKKKTTKSGKFAIGSIFEAQRARAARDVSDERQEEKLARSAHTKKSALKDMSAARV